MHSNFNYSVISELTLEIVNLQKYTLFIVI